MQQMGERKLPSPDLFFAQKTMAFMLCLYNPCFPASARDPDKDSKKNKMSVGGPLTPRANCARVRDSMMSGLSPPFLQGASGTPTGREEEQNHRGSSGNHPNAWAVGICSHPCCPARPGCSSATCGNLSTVRGAARTSPAGIPPLPSNAGTMLGEPGFSGLPDSSHTTCREEAEVRRPGPDKTRSALVHLCPPSLPTGVQSISSQAPYSYPQREGTTSPEAAGDKGGWSLLEKWWEAASWAAGGTAGASPQAGMMFVSH